MTAATMPSGVEHLLLAQHNATGEVVTAATMPSGVEHVVGLGDRVLEAR